MARSTVSSAAAVFIIVAFLMVCVIVREANGAVTCKQVSTAATPCIGYIRNGGSVPASCCNGVQNLKFLASTTADRQAACNCLKTLIQSISEANLGLAAGIPDKCGINVPFPISPSADCTKVAGALSSSLGWVISKYDDTIHGE